jgi:hypothetical protein
MAELWFWIGCEDDASQPVYDPSDGCFAAQLEVGTTSVGAFILGGLSSGVKILGWIFIGCI